MSAQTATRRPGNRQDDERAEVMYDRYRAGLSLREVGRQFGVSAQALHRLFQRRGWPMREKRPPPPPHGIPTGGSAPTYTRDPASMVRHWELRARECDEEAAAATAMDDAFEAKRWARRAREWRSMIAELPN